MNGIENRLVCLSLNSVWYPIGYKRVRDAISNLFSGNFLALDIQYADTGFSNLKSITPLAWEKWVELPVRGHDFSISSPTLRVRVPTVIVSKNFSKVPFTETKFSKKGIFTRDKGVCQYSNKVLKKTDVSIDHVIPRYLGGENSWENAVICHKELNSRKGIKTIDEAGLKLIKEPREPLMASAMNSINDIFHLDWQHFLINKI